MKNKISKVKFKDHEFVRIPKLNSTCVTYIDQFSNTVTFDKCPTKSTMTQEFKANYPLIPVIEILDIFVVPEHRHQGIGSIIIETISRIYENYAILVLVGASEKEYPNLDEKDIPKILDSLLPFYEKNKFINVNNIFGSYNNFIPMLHIGNPAGRYIGGRLGSLEKSLYVSDIIYIIMEI